MCDGRRRPQTVTVKYSENSLGQLACIKESEPLLLEALGKDFTENNAKFNHGSKQLNKLL